MFLATLVLIADGQPVIIPPYLTDTSCVDCEEYPDIKSSIATLPPEERTKSYLNTPSQNGPNIGL